MAQAVAFLVAKKVSRIILARPAVEAGEKLGFLPGDLQEKVNPYLRPLYDALYDMLDVERVARYIERGTIEIAPIAFMRGRTLNDSFVILDEAQNTTSEQMKMFLTRLGFGSKAVITGDITQIDLPTGRTSGLVEAMKVVGAIEGISFVYFDDRDVVRHKLVQQIVKAYEAFSNGNGALGLDDAGRRLRGPTLDASRRRHVGRAACASSWSTSAGRPVPARGLARWLRRVAPARARGVGQHRARQRRARPRAEPHVPAARTTRPTCCQFPAARNARTNRPARSLRAPRRAGFLGDIVIARGVARRQARAAGIRADRAAGAGAARPAASARLRSRARHGPDGARRAAAAAQGRPARRADRAGTAADDDSAQRSSCSACAAVYLGAIEAAFSALMRLSLRLVAERSDRPGRARRRISTTRCCCSSRCGCCSAWSPAAATALLARGDRRRRRARR